jgi:hypothetical protein
MEHFVFLLLFIPLVYTQTSTICDCDILKPIVISQTNTCYINSTREIAITPETQVLCKGNGSLIVTSEIHVRWFSPCVEVIFRFNNVILDGGTIIVESALARVEVVADSLLIKRGGGIYSPHIDIQTKSFSMNGQRSSLMVTPGYDETLLINTTTVNLSNSVAIGTEQGVSYTKKRKFTLWCDVIETNRNVQIRDYDNVEIHARHVQIGKPSSDPEPTLMLFIEHLDINAVTMNARDLILAEFITINIFVKTIDWDNVKIINSNNIKVCSDNSVISLIAEKSCSISLSYVESAVILINTSQMIVNNSNILTTGLGHLADEGEAHGEAGSEYGGGGGNGGWGNGDCYNITQPSSIAKIDTSNPWNYGSGGGSKRLNQTNILEYGSRGGGKMNITVNVLHLDDSVIAANGESNVMSSGAGAGGTIQLNVAHFKGNGRIEAVGGKSKDGGSGGGGIIFFRSPGPIELSDITFDVSGGESQCKPIPMKASQGKILHAHCKPNYYTPDTGCLKCKLLQCITNLIDCNDSMCGEHGYCDKFGDCACHDQWWGPSCLQRKFHSMIILTIIAWCDQNCTIHGTCVAINNCSCIGKWHGSLCELGMCSYTTHHSLF